MTEQGTALSVVGKHIDGLEVSVSGKPLWSVFEDLSAKKGDLRASPHGLWEFGAISGVPGGPLVLTTEGGSKYQFVLRNGAVRRLEVTSRGALPEVMIQFRAAALYEHDLKEMEGIVGALAGRFVQPGYEVKVSSLDVAFDFQSAQWRWPEMDDIVCRARRRNVHYEGTAITGMTFGRAHGPLQVVIYDKSRQLELVDKEWMNGVWAKCESYDERLPVVRTELRFGRAILRDFKVENIATLRSREGDLIRYAVGSERPWFRVVSTETRGRRQDRRGTARWWREASQHFLEGPPLTGRIRRRDASSVPALKRARSTMITNAVQTAAWERILGDHAADSPEQYLGPFALKGLSQWLKSNNLSSWDRAVDFKAKKIVASGGSSVVWVPAG